MVRHFGSSSVSNPENGTHLLCSLDTYFLVYLCIPFHLRDGSLTLVWCYVSVRCGVVWCGVLLYI